MRWLELACAVVASVLPPCGALHLVRVRLRILLEDVRSQHRSARLRLQAVAPLTLAVQRDARSAHDTVVAAPGDPDEHGLGGLDAEREGGVGLEQMDRSGHQVRAVRRRSWRMPVSVSAEPRAHRVVRLHRHFSIGRRPCRDSNLPLLIESIDKCRLEPEAGVRDRRTCPAACRRRAARTTRGTYVFSCVVLAHPHSRAGGRRVRYQQSLQPSLTTVVFGQQALQPQQTTATRARSRDATSFGGDRRRGPQPT